ncbi:MAG: hypothetical protein Q9179_007461, partial [Wetmoreana sp. 5 TL-2023]
DFFTRDPTPNEIIAMLLLSVNHGAKGIVAWSFPTTREIVDMTGFLTKVVQGHGFEEFVLGARRENVPVVGGEGMVDAAAWRRGKAMLISVVSTGDRRSASDLMYLDLPGGRHAVRFRNSPLGRVGWRLLPDKRLACPGFWTDGMWGVLLEVDLSDD